MEDGLNKTREQVEKEVREMNRWKELVSDAVKCDFCGGSGRTMAPLFGDPALGYSDAGPCSWCKGIGEDKTKVYIS